MHVIENEGRVPKNAMFSVKTENTGARARMCVC